MQCGFTPFCVKSDADRAVNLDNFRNHANSGCGNIVSVILDLMKVLGFSSILASTNGSNKLAVALARQAILRKVDIYWRRPSR